MAVMAEQAGLFDVCQKCGGAGKVRAGAYSTMRPCPECQTVKEPHLADIPVPHQKHSDTSRAAALKMQPRFKGLRMKVYDLLKEHGPLIDERGAELLGISGDSYRPSRITLAGEGYLEQCGEGTTRRGNRAVLWGVAK